MVGVLDEVVFGTGGTQCVTDVDKSMVQVCVIGLLFPP